MTDNRLLIRVGHSPDPDDAFMFYALAQGKIQTGPFRFVHEMADIETLNRRAFSGELELTAVSLHAYARLTARYVLSTCGASMGDRYGPMVVARRPLALEDLAAATIAVPGTLTTAYLALRLCLGRDFPYVVVPFDQILDAAAAGNFQGQPIDAGLVIHEGQLTYARQQLVLVADMGQWWFDETGLPLPLGGNVLRRDLGRENIAAVQRLLRASIVYGLEHRPEALEYALTFGRGLDRGLADQFVGMYVNDWTLDFGPRGREAVAQLLARGYAAGVIPELVVPEFAE
ncbi:MAG: menaquinone biosynthesis family protein [Thermoguttaceae bacterium]